MATTTQRPRCTPLNILHQQMTAPKGAVIHWAGAKHCKRKRSRKDVRTVPLTPELTEQTLRTLRTCDLALSPGKITYTAIVHWLGNVNCLACRKEAAAAGVKDWR